jgi:DNA-binding NarL/FixJ family response regulator|uniref:DNA-binding response regulator n=2 Tax=Thermocrispum agreste TaxID=37925 RepID=A0A2W4INC0_9PSEU|nr:MAG: DNA-binding response regulator [Thermocrispum agreste]
MAADTGSTTGTDIDHGPTGDTGGTGPNGPDRDRGREIGREITVAVIDDHPAVAAGIQAWYAASDPPIRVVASGSTAQTAWLPPGRDADVVVLDLLLAPDHPECYGDLRRLADAGRRVIVYTMREDEQVALTCLELGAFTFLTKAEGQQHLVDATIAAAHDRPYIAPALAGAFAADTKSHRPQLSAREQEVLIEWFQCESKQAVARRIGITPNTVGTYLDRVRLKYANVGRPAPTKAALVVRAIQDGIITLEEL